MSDEARGQVAPTDETQSGAPEDRVQIFDTTLRDGEQSPGISLNTAEKLEIAQQLARLGVDVIEAGFPITSPGDFEAVQAIARKVEGPVICGLARTHKADIDAAWEAVKDAERPRIHTFISTSRHPHRAPAADHARGRARARRGPPSRTPRRYCDDVEFSPMDATRADVEFTAEVCADRDRRGRDRRSTSPTPSATRCPRSTPSYLRAALRAACRTCATSTLSVHCHDDLGLAVANSFAGVLAGARQVECAINGIGERAGNSSLEEIVMLLHTRRADVHGLRHRHQHARDRPHQPPGLAPDRLRDAAEQGDRRPQRLRPRVRHPPGRRAEGAHAPTRSWTRPTVGLESNSIVLGKHSGRHALQDALEELGFKVDGARAEHRPSSASRRSRTRRSRSPRWTWRRSSPTRCARRRGYELDWFDVEASSTRASRTRRSRSRMPDGAQVEGVGHRRRPGRRDLPRDQRGDRRAGEAGEYRVDAVSSGQDALGEVTVVLELDGRTASGQGVSTDTVQASGRAYARALTNAERRRGVVDEAEGAAARAAASNPVAP